MRAIRFSPVGCAIALFCACGCHDLCDAWRFSPFDRFGWIALSAWGAPLCLAWRRAGSEGAPAPTPALLVAGLGMGLLGALGNLNALQHMGLALSLVGLLPWRWGNVAWLAAAASWMPAAGWALGRGLDIEAVLLLRLTAALAAALWMGIQSSRLMAERETHTPWAERRKAGYGQRWLSPFF